MPGKQSRIILCMLLIILVVPAPETQAVPAAPVVHHLRQPDGDVFAARQWGDEFLSGWETECGYTIIFDREQSAWTYAEPGSSGELASSRLRVGKETPPGLMKGVRSKAGRRPTRRARPFARTTALSGEPAVPSAAAAPPAPSSRSIPVILINFNDTATTCSSSDFSSLLFGSGTWSFKDYYEEISGGAFTVSPGPAGVLGWYTAANGHDYYGQPSGWGPPDKWPGDLAYEAVSQADATVDFSAFDSDGDCIVDVVAIIHQGTAQEASATAADIWSQSWSLSSTYSYGLGHQGAYTSNDVCPSDPGLYMLVDDYIMMPETLPAALDPGMTTIGVFAHEYGHVLGLIDLYDTDRPANSEGVGNWSLMASGSWGKVERLGDRPSHLDPWSKRALGWLEPNRIQSGQTGKTIPAVEGNSQVWQFREGSPAAGGEYFLLENRQRTGFDAALPGSGMLLWHIDESRSGNSSEWYPGCSTCSSHYKVALLQADNLYDLEHKTNRGDGGDPFPGNSLNRSIDHLTSPASRLYNGEPAGFSLTAISDSSATMSADISLSDGIPPVTTLTATPASLSNTPSASFAFTASEAATFECRLDNTGYLPCTSPRTYLGLSDGQHSFSVRSIDLTGTVEAAPPGYSWSVDTVPPETELLATPPAVTANLYGSFSFATNKAGATFSCSLDSGIWSSCTSPHAVSGLNEGNHSFVVRASDLSGNSDPTPANFSWNVARNVLLSLANQQDSFHISPGSALSTVASGTPALLLVRNIEISEDLTIAVCAPVTLEGGYTPGFTSIVGQATIRGAVKVLCGKLSVKGLTIRANL